MIDPKLQQFLEKELIVKWQKPVEFHPEMKLYKDFKLEGEDAEEFLMHFIKEFNVKFGENFNFNERFYPEYDPAFIKNIFAPILALFNTVSKNNQPQLKDLSIAELQKAIHTGILE